MCIARPSHPLHLLLIPRCACCAPLPPLLQVLGQALGGKTFKLKFGHHGGNHPLRHTPTGAHDLVAGAGQAVEWHSVTPPCSPLLLAPASIA